MRENCPAKRGRFGVENIEIVKVKWRFGPSWVWWEKALQYAREGFGNKGDAAVE